LTSWGSLRCSLRTLHVAESKRRRKDSRETGGEDGGKGRGLGKGRRDGREREEKERGNVAPTVISTSRRYMAPIRAYVGL